MSKRDSKGGSKVKIRPLQDRVLIKRIDEQEQVRGGIIIPDTAKEKPQEAEVIAVGPGKLDDDGKRLPVDVKVGDKVLVGKYSGSDIKIDGEDYVILREDEILAVVG
jgi:chaperonin GroES